MKWTNLSHFVCLKMKQSEIKWNKLNAKLNRSHIEHYEIKQNKVSFKNSSNK